jgi:hypothetical protein
LLEYGPENLAFFRYAQPFQEVRARRKLKHLQNKDIVFRNTLQEIEYVLKILSETGPCFEFE